MVFFKISLAALKVTVPLDQGKSWSQCSASWPRFSWLPEASPTTCSRWPCLLGLSRKKKSQRKFLPSRPYEYIRHLWKIARITPVFFLFSVQCFRKGPQLQTWSACRPMCWNGRHLGRISLERPYFPMLMPDYIIEGNTQAAAQGNSWQDGVNALVML